MMSAAEIRSLRHRLGWSQRELATQLGISRSRVADYELGETRGLLRRPAPIPRAIELACMVLSAAQP